MVETRRLGRAALRGRAVLRQAGPHLLADGRGDEGLRHDPGRRRAWCRSSPRSACCSRPRGSGRSSSTGAPRSAGALVLATTLAFLSFGRVAMSDMLLALWTTLAVGARRPRLRGRRAPPWARAAARRRGRASASRPRARSPLLVPGLAVLLLLWEKPAPAAPGWPPGRARPRRPRLRASSASAGSRSSTGALGPGAARLLLLPREPRALRRRGLRRRPAASGSTRRPTSPRACRGRPSSRSRSGACCARARATRRRAARFLALWVGARARAL